MKLSVVLLEYNSIDEIKRAVDVIRRYDLNCEIIVSSNSLYDVQKMEEARIAVPDAIWTFNKENGGFGYGMNRGAEVASGEYVAFLNSDVRIRADFSSLIQYLETHENVGLIAPELVDENGVVQDSYRKAITLSNIITRIIGHLLHTKHDLKKTRPVVVDWVIGAFMLTKKTFFDLVGGFDDKTYFMYVEDADLCHELKLKGFDTVYFPLASAQYVGTRSSHSSLKYMKIHLHSLLAYMKKNRHRR